MEEVSGGGWVLRNRAARGPSSSLLLFCLLCTYLAHFPWCLPWNLMVISTSVSLFLLHHFMTMAHFLTLSLCFCRFLYLLTSVHRTLGPTSALPDAEEQFPLSFSSLKSSSVTAMSTRLHSPFLTLDQRHHMVTLGFSSWAKFCL